ncbi:hypothetical protein PBY51_005761 [Eleginops maclovinus]|uniref:Ig-like domain-containing protein n=1 Tax=Eleginops maclovinus TaxID=56733 RepID=A0AAN7WAV6_ELEMC|nr:hypothetical protein PBY51_005761 [Eleginops maclovinus]
MVVFGVFVLGFFWPLWSFLAAETREEAFSGRHLIGPHQPIIAFLGDDVILPCSVAPDYDVRGLTVEWSQPDLKPDPSDRLGNVEYVYVYRRRREEVDMKLPAFVGRTALFREELKVGNISLKISNVTLADAGKYRCFIPKLEGGVKEALVLLVVEPKTNSTLMTESQTPPQTPDQNQDQNQETDDDEGRPLWILAVCTILGLAVGVYLLRNGCGCQKKTKCNLYESAS